MLHLTRLSPSRVREWAEGERILVDVLGGMGSSYQAAEVGQRGV